MPVCKLPLLLLLLLLLLLPSCPSATAVGRAAEDIVQSSTRPLWVGVVMMCGEGFKVIAARGRGCKEGLPCVEAVLVS